ncbi:MAG: SDR family NAD(P)-dependent oxidoreductase [Solirubrobacterales bacterium]|nr:SDR family NAD(P)-dependent oxidoreductase [Solirubrobacterales bacterium]
MEAASSKAREVETPPALEDGALRGKVALVTGGANGLGKAFAEALLEQDAIVMIADIDEVNGNAVAEDLGCAFEPLDVTDAAANADVIAKTTDRFGGLHLVLLNAGIESPFSLGDDFDPEAYRWAMSINLDAVVYGFHAARPALIESGGGSVLATASLAGLAAMAPQPVYGANKAAVVALARALGPAHAHEGIRVNAICPGFADTAIITGVREALTSAGVPIIEPRTVADAALRVLASEDTGRALVVQAGVDPYYSKFANIPRAR